MFLGLGMAQRMDFSRDYYPNGNLQATHILIMKGHYKIAF
jgi:hypothetical protein